MQTLLVNAAVMVWGVLLLCAPAFALAVRGRLTAALLAGVTVCTLVVVCCVTYLVSLAGYGTIGPLRVLAAMLAAVLVWDLVQAVRVFSAVRAGGKLPATEWDLLALPAGLLVGVWVMAPPLLTLARTRQRFGFATVFNADLPNYVLLADNVAASGFVTTNHLAGLDIGSVARHYSYMGPTALLNFLTAATGLAAWKVAFAAMGVAVCLSVFALWAFVRTLWPSASYGVGSAVVLASLASLSVYLVSQYFLGGVLELVSIATSLAGATMLAREEDRPRMVGVLAMAGGAALGVYSYGHLGLPTVVLLPVWTLLVAFLRGDRTRAVLARPFGRAVGACALALVVSAVAVPTAWTLLRSQGVSLAGWSAPPMGAGTMLFWPPGILQPSSPGSVLASWAAVAFVVALGLLAAWHRGSRESVITGSVFAAGCLAVIAVFVVIYGGERYQAWKMQSLLLPLIIVAVVPALGALRFGRARLGAGLLLVCVGVTALGPVLDWQSTKAVQDAGPSAAASSRWTSEGLVDLADSPALERLASVNVRLASTFETLSAAAILPTGVIVLSSTSYYVPTTSLRTCTLTRMDMLTPGETAFTSLGGGYVLLQRPSKCASKK